MRVPTRLPIGGKNVTIKYPDVVPGDSLEEGDLAGDTNDTGTQIRISRLLHTSEEAVWHTLFHELVHSAFAITGHSQSMVAKQEEALVYGLENMLAAVMQLRDITGSRWKEIEFPFEADA